MLGCLAMSERGLFIKGISAGQWTFHYEFHAQYLCSSLMPYVAFSSIPAAAVI